MFNEYYTAEDTKMEALATMIYLIEKQELDRGTNGY